MEKIKNDILLRMVDGQKCDRYPVWLMRQAGRILPEYRAVRAKLNGFKELVKTPALAAEVTIQPVELLNVDAAIIFSDILVIPEAMGFDYEMIEAKGPYFEKTLRGPEDFHLIDQNIDIADRLSYVTEAIKETKKGLTGKVPLIGFAGAPWTIFCYMTEGQGSKTFSKAKKIVYTEPAFAHKVLAQITDVTIAYLKEQIKAGANIVQLFDSWAGILSPSMYSEFGTKYVRRICDAIQEVPVTVFAKGAYYAREELATLSCATIGLDWNMDITESRKLIGKNKTLQGNLDPCVLYSNYETIKEKTKLMLNSFDNQRHIANLGHGVYPSTNPDKVKCFIDTVKGFTIN